MRKRRASRFGRTSRTADPIDAIAEQFESKLRWERSFTIDQRAVDSPES